MSLVELWRCYNKAEGRAGAGLDPAEKEDKILFPIKTPVLQFRSPVDERVWQLCSVRVHRFLGAAYQLEHLCRLQRGPNQCGWRN